MLNESGFAIVKKAARSQASLSFISWAVGRAGPGHGRSEGGTAPAALQGRDVPVLPLCTWTQRGTGTASPALSAPERHNYPAERCQC